MRMALTEEEERLQDPILLSHIYTSQARHQLILHDVQWLAGDQRAMLAIVTGDLKGGTKNKGSENLLF